MTDTCGTCRFAKRDETMKKNYGWCRRYPPLPVASGARYNTVDVERPWVRSDDWCGEYQKGDGQ